MMPGKILYRIQTRYTSLPAVATFITGQFKRIPNITGEETGTPIVDRNIVNATILINGTRIKHFTRFDNVCLKCFLCHCIINILLNEIICSLFLSCTTC